MNQAQIEAYYLNDIDTPIGTSMIFNQLINIKDPKIAARVSKIATWTIDDAIRIDCPPGADRQVAILAAVCASSVESLANSANNCYVKTISAITLPGPAAIDKVSKWLLLRSICSILGLNSQAFYALMLSKRDGRGVLAEVLTLVAAYNLLGVYDRGQSK
jgi:hypothetical protein